MDVSTNISRIGGGVRGEVRGLNIVYFLSRTDCVEHPHLIQVHHLIRSGIFLRDVKKWLAELRGKDMPESFAWSCKRRYKNGYVWQDLMDDDLITPISDNEYILKGSKILSVSPASGLKTSSVVAKHKTRVTDDDPEVEVKDKQQDLQEQSNQNIDTSSVQACQSYPESLSSTLTDDDSIKQEDTKPSEHSSPEDHLVRSSVEENLSPSLYCDFHANHSEKRNNDNKRERTLSSPFVCGLPSHYKLQFARSTKSSGSGTTKMIRNLMRCGGTDISDAVLVGRPKSKPTTEHDVKSQIRNEDTVKESMQVFRAPFKLQYLQQETRKSFHGVQNSKSQQRLSGTGRHRTLAAPTCSQCGKSFRPEKLHAHMTSCRGMRGFSKTKEHRRAN